jgi:hypothetical protein
LLHAIVAAVVAYLHALYTPAHPEKKQIPLTRIDMNKSLADLLFVVENLSDQRLRIERALLQQMSKQPLPTEVSPAVKSLLQEGLILAEHAVGTRNALEKEFLRLLKKSAEVSEKPSYAAANPEPSPQPLFAGTISIKLNKNHPSVTVPITVHNHYTYPQSIIVECSDLYDSTSGQPFSQSVIAEPAFVRVEGRSSVKINIHLSLPDTATIKDSYQGNVLLKGIEIRFFRLVVDLHEKAEPPAIIFSEPE